MAHTIISDPAQLSGIHLKFSLPVASATRITHPNFTESVAFFGLSTTFQVPSGSAGTVFLCYTVSLPNMVIRWASSGSTGTIYVGTLYGLTTPCYTIHCS